jgi:hypothetical protein
LPLNHREKYILYQLASDTVTQMKISILAEVLIINNQYLTRMGKRQKKILFFVWF